MSTFRPRHFMFILACFFAAQTLSANGFAKRIFDEWQNHFSLELENACPGSSTLFMPPPATTTVSVRVNAGSDDAEENVTSGAMALASSDLELTIDGTAYQFIGLRFNGMTIPAGATITNAYVEFECDEVSTGFCNNTIWGEAADNPGTFTTATNNIALRNKTTSFVTYEPSDWNTVNEKHATPDLTNIIQEIVDRPGWASGNSMVIIMAGSTGKRTAESYEGEAAAAPLLVVEYTTGSSCPNAVSNPEFDNGTTDWYLYMQSGNTASGSVDNSGQLSGTNSGLVDISAVSGTNWHIQLASHGHTIEAGKNYTVSFQAKAAANRNIGVSLQRSNSPWTTYWWEDVSLTTAGNSYSFDFQVDSTNAGDVGLLFHLGETTANVWIDNVSFSETCSGAIEICGNGIDDDGDGLVDGSDPDCCSTGSLTVERWTGISGVYITDLTGNAAYPNSPSETTEITSFDGPDNIADNYGTRVRGYISPTETGTYLFNLTCDDHGELYLSSDETEGNKSLIANLNGWTGTTEHTKYTSQTSSSINLTAGQNYYVELLHKEGGGGDHYQVYWQTPSNSTWTIVPGSHLKPFNCASVSTEICGNGLDDDGDGQIDCADSDCQNITLSTPTVSACIDHPLRDVATVSVDVSWTNAPASDMIEVVVGDKTEYIDVAGGATSPQTVLFVVPADGASNVGMSASWQTNTSLCAATTSFNVPSSCSTCEINVDILYLCGEDKPYDGDPWDHGWIEYLDEMNGAATVTPILTKPDGSGMGTYDPMNTSTFVTVNLADYDLIIVSATTEAHISNDLVTALKDVPAGLLNGNYQLINDFGMSSVEGGYTWGASAYTDNTTSVEVTNYDNINPSYSYVITRGDYASSADAYLWAYANNQSSETNGYLFHYEPTDALPGVSSSHGDRVHLGFHMNGIYANPVNGGALPAPVSTWFSPEKHLTLEGKYYFDQAILMAAGGCSSSPTFTCPSGLLSNPDFESGTTSWATAGTTSITTDAYSGSQAIINTAADGGVWQEVATTAGNVFSLSAYAKKTGAAFPVIGIKYMDASWNTLEEINIGITSTTYQEYQASLIAPANTAWVQAFGWSSNGAGEAYFDAFCLENWAVTAPACANASCALQPDFDRYIWAMDDSGTDANWLDWDNADLMLCDNGDGTLGVKGNIIRGHDAVWHVSNATPCGAQDGWYVDLTLSDMQSWAEFGGTYAVEAACPNAYQNLDYWNVVGSLTGIGCNSGRTITIDGPYSGYRFQIGSGGNSHSCGFGMSTWFDASTDGHAVWADIYAHVDSVCYYSMRPTPEICDNGIDDDGDGDIDGADSDCTSCTPINIGGTPINPLSGNEGFQVISEGDFTFTGYTHVHGALAVGGDLILNNSNNSILAEICMDGVSSYAFPGDNGNTTGLLVKGGVNWSGGGAKVMGGRMMHIGNSTGCTESDNGTNMATQVLPSGASYNNTVRIEGAQDQTPTPAVFQTIGLDFNCMFDNFRIVSEGLSNCGSNIQLKTSGGVDISGNNVTYPQFVEVDNLINGTNYLNLSQSSLNNITEFKFNPGAMPSASSPVVISVELTSDFVWNNCNFPGLSGSVHGPYVFWNFWGTTSHDLTINTGSLVIGSIFAPNHFLYKAGIGDIEGNIVAKTIQLGEGEVHYYPFANAVEMCGASNSFTCTSGLLSNPSFENGLTDWTMNGTGGTVTNDANSGTQAVTVTADDAGIYQNFNCNPGETYKLSFAAKKTGTMSWAGVGIIWWDASWNKLDEVVYDNGSFTNSYQNFEIIDEVPPGTAFGQAYVWRSAGNTGSVEADDFCLEMVNGSDYDQCGEVYNGGFEYDFLGWQGDLTGATISSDSHTGSKALELTANATRISREIKPINVGSVYELSFQAKRLGNSGWGEAGMVWYDDSWNNLGNSYVTLDSFINNYQTIELSTVAPAGATRLAVHVFKNNGDNILIDEICVSENPGTGACTCTDNLFINGGFETHTSSVTFPQSVEGGSNPLQVIVGNDPDKVPNWAGNSGTPGYNFWYYLDNTGGAVNNPEGDYFAWIPGDFCSSTVLAVSELHLEDGVEYELCVQAAAWNIAHDASGNPTGAAVSQGNAELKLELGSPANAWSHVRTDWELPASPSWDNLNWQRLTYRFVYDSSEPLYGITLTNISGIGAAIDAVSISRVDCPGNSCLYLQNPEFEDGFNDWDTGGANVTMLTSGGYAGTNSASVGADSYVSQWVPVDPAKDYEIDFWAKRPSTVNGYAEFGYNFYDANSNLISGYTYGLPIMDNSGWWKGYNASITNIPENALYLNFWFSAASGAADPLYVDHVCMTQIQAFEDCGNGIDDDGDGATDCSDTECGRPTNGSLNVTHPTCPYPYDGEIIVNATGSNLEYSIDGGDTWSNSNVFSGLTHGTYLVMARNSVTGCSIFINNGGIKPTTSLNDPDCPEICDNGLDDDGDGAIDSNDPNCDDCTSTLLTNRGFADDLNGWTELGNTSFFLETNGNQYIRLTGAEEGVSQNVAVSPGDQVTVNFFAKNDVSDEAQGGFTFLDASLVQIGGEIVETVNSTTFQKYTVTATAPANAAWVKVFAWNNVGAGDAGFDEFCLRIGLEEICGNGLDDDGDGFIDGADPDCGLDPNVCFLISDGDGDGWDTQDTLYTFDHTNGNVTAVGPTGTKDIESMAMDVANGIIYVVSKDTFGTLNPATAAFTPISTDMGTVDGANGNIDIGDIDGLTFDAVNNIVWASVRTDGVDGLPDDLLIKINPATGMPVQDAFGAGVDYVVVVTNEHDIDDLALAPDGTLYAISNFGGSGNQRLGTINKTTGVFTEIGDYGIHDVEGLMYSGSGQLLATTGNAGIHKNQLYSIDAGTATPSFIGSIFPAFDVEACACENGSFVNLQIGDKVWADLDSDGIQDLGEPGVENVTVNLLDGSGNPILDGSSNPISTTTDSWGEYNFDRLTPGNYMVEFVLPSGATFTTQNAGSDDAIDSDANTGTGRSHVITLSGSTNDYNVDAGLLNTNATVRTCADEDDLLVADETGNILRFDHTTGVLIDTFIKGLGRPRDIIVGPDNYLYISDEVTRTIRRFSLTTGAYIDDLIFLNDIPHGMVFGPDGFLYVNNRYADEVVKIDPATGTSSVFIPSGSGLDNCASGILFGPDGNLYVASFNTDEVLRFDGTTGALIDIFVTANSSNVNAPWDMVFGPDGNLYVSGKYNDKVSKYNGTTGAYMGGFVTYQSGGIGDPTDITFGPNGNLFVSAQSGTIGVLEYDGSTGAYIGVFANAPIPNGLLFAPVPNCDEICGNSIDDDGDGFVDCLDPDCDRIDLFNLTVSSCIDHPLQDVATVSVDVSWANEPANDTIEVSIYGKTEYIDVAGGATSPQTITFVVPADGSTANVLRAAWRANTSLCDEATLFNAPTACSNDQIACNILYLCGEDKPYDGDAWDHGWIEYLDEVNGSATVTPILTKPDGSGMGTYDVMNPSTFVNVNLNDYELIIVSATTEAHIATDLIVALKDLPAAIINSNYQLINDFGMSTVEGGYQFQSHLYIDDSNSKTIYNYNNDLTPHYSKVFTRGNYSSAADAYLWTNSGEQSSGINGVYFAYSSSDAMPGISSSHGPRVYLGYHMNGVYANDENGGALPAPVESYFNPATHLTLDGKFYFDQAILEAAVSCNTELCNNGIDDDGDGLIDCADPDCEIPILNNVTSNSPNNCPSVNNGQITINGTGSNLEYSIDGGLTYQSSNVFTGLHAGTFNVRIRIVGSSCFVDYVNNPVVLSEPTCNEICDNGIDDDGDGLIDCADSDCGPSVYAGTDVNICVGANHTISASGSGGEEPYSYNWNIGAGQDQTVSPALGTTTYYVTITDSNGCTATDEMDVIVTNCAEDCTDGIDNDGDGLIDCDDPDCTAYGQPRPLYDEYVTCPGVQFIEQVIFNDDNLQNPTFSIYSNATYGSVNIDNEGIFTYSPYNTICGNDAFVYEVCNQTTGCCDTASVFIEIGDTIAPLLKNIPADITISCDEEVPEIPISVYGEDMCPGIYLSFDEESNQPNPGSCQTYEITRTWTVTDLCGNSRSGTQTITVLDNESPEIFRVYTLENGSKIMGGISNRLTDNWKYVEFPINFENIPVVFTQVNSSNENTAVNCRIRNVSVQGFELRLQEEENQDGDHVAEEVGWVAVEKGSLTDDSNLQIDELENINSNASILGYANTFSGQPVFIGALQTFNDSDPVAIKFSNASPSTINVFLEEETSGDTEVVHGNEDMAYFAMEPGVLLDNEDVFVGESGSLVLDENWQTIPLTRIYSKPVVIFGGIQSGTDPAIVRVKNVTTTSFDVHIQEWENYDGNLTNKTVSYFVMEGSIPAASEYFCSNTNVVLEPGINLFAVDNCDDQLNFEYSEVSEVTESGMHVHRSWSCADDCGNDVDVSRTDTCVLAAVRLNVFLGGALIGSPDGMMRDDLRKWGYLPLEEPYTELGGFTHKGNGGGETTTQEILDVTGQDAIVDWVFVEVRSSYNPDEVLATCSALVQRDGDVVRPDGEPIIFFPTLNEEDYFVTVRHRNHLGLMTKYVKYLSTNAVPAVQFGELETDVHGDYEAANELNGTERKCWAGDLNGDGRVIYQGPSNDVFALFSLILSSPDNDDFLANYIRFGYHSQDLDMNGKAIYQGPGNDRSHILYNTVLVHPGNGNFLSNYIVNNALP